MRPASVPGQVASQPDETNEELVTERLPLLQQALRVVSEMLHVSVDGQRLAGDPRTRL